MEQNKDQIGAAVRGEAVAKCALPPAGWYCTRTAGHDGPCAAYPVNSTAAEHEAAILEVIDQRDKYHDMADQLAAQIAAMTEVEIGEHSSANEPWRNALIAGDEFIAAKFKAFCNGPVSARAADAPSEPSELKALEDAVSGLDRFAESDGEGGGVYASKDGQFILRSSALVAIHEAAKVKSRAADALDSQPTDLPNGWEIVRVGDDIHLKRDGKWCGYSQVPESPAHRMTYEFLDDLLRANSQPQPARQSIGEDARFQLLMFGSVGLDPKGSTFKRIVDYIDIRASAAPVTPDVDLPDALSSLLWMYRRLPRAYGRLPSVEKTILSIATATKTVLDDFFTERAPAPQQEGSEAGNG